LLISTVWGFAGHMFMKSKYPGRGIQVYKNILKETCSFEKAIEALKEGKRIRRKSEMKGYTKLTIIEGKNQQEKYGSYWVSRSEKIEDYCTFSIEDVLATDWLVDN
jgi:hypothetical protein